MKARVPRTHGSHKVALLNTTQMSEMKLVLGAQQAQAE